MNRWNDRLSFDRKSISIRDRFFAVHLVELKTFSGLPRQAGSKSPTAN
jgi:hypothetical protein